MERKWGVTFVNVAALARHHAAHTTVPMSRHLTFVPGRAEVLIRCYLHTSDHAPQGWYERAQRTGPAAAPLPAVMDDLMDLEPHEHHLRDAE